jgi:hypothetical protein
METFIPTFIIFVLSILGLAAGIIFGRQPIAGSCGGLSCHKGIDCGTCKFKQKKGETADGQCTSNF